MRHGCGGLPLLVTGVLAAGCATQTSAVSSSTSRSTAPAPARKATPTTVAAAVTIPRSHPQAVEPVAGAASPIVASPAPAPPTTASVGPSARGPLPEPVSDAEVRQQLAQSGLAANPDQAQLTPNGLALPPVAAPSAVQAVITAGNAIAHLPYVWGGGHGTYEDTGYDCSGSISFVFGAAGLLKGPVVSGDLMSYGDPGPGKWITIFANPGHTFMYVAGLRFDTVALAETGTRWSDRPANEPDLRAFSVRHPPGL